MNDKNGAYLSAMESLMKPVDGLSRAQFAMESLMKDELSRAQFAMESLTKDELSRAQFAMESLMKDELSRAQAAMESLMKPVDGLSRAQAAMESLMKPVNEFRRMQATIESLMKPPLDWQKQLNLLKATQASLGFPNIIKSRLSIDSFPPLVPGRSYAPLPVPPTAVTDEAYEEISPENIPAPSPELVPITNHKPVFIVHGHDHETRDDVSKFVSNWGLTATILDKQPNKGRTIIEKFEDCADEASFAIVLLTPDDVGASVKDKAHLKYRTRQNVIFELGYFFGSIGRKGVCILYKGNLELPSDMQGVVYVRMDDNGEWKQTIVREMESAGILIDGNKI